MATLASDLRKSLDKAVVAARDEAESACEAALRALGVPADQAPPGISDEQRALRNALRAKQRQLGGAFEQLLGECAYEQWHLMLFARFLSENELLIHPSGASVTLDEVAELAREEGESDSWMLAARYAAAMLPGIFKPADPCVRLPLAPEGRRALEDILAALPSGVFTADDALGWVYQFWQTKRKKEVNASERKIGGADLAPVTQLFTEHYMVRFLLENSLGAWWAARHPQSPLLAEWEYLRFADDREPAAGRFEGWPASAGDVTVMDPCCGSGHFLVAAFEMLRRMREQEECLSTREAVDAVLADNLFGLELDARCVQLGAFALALAAWKASGYHELPPLNLACSGIPTRGSLEDWTKLAEGDERLKRALTRLHELFRDADTLGSLIDPRREVEDGSLMSVPFEEVAPLLERAQANDPDPVAAVFGEGAREVARAAMLLAGSYTLVATNPPFLSRWGQTDLMVEFCELRFSLARTDLATCFILRSLELAGSSGGCSLVTPQSWMYLGSYRELRRGLLSDATWCLVARLGPRAFEMIGGEVVAVALLCLTSGKAPPVRVLRALDASDALSPADKARQIRIAELLTLRQSAQAGNPDSRIVLGEADYSSVLSDFAFAHQGLKTTDDPRFLNMFWEAQGLLPGWEAAQSSTDRPRLDGGRERVVFYEGGRGQLRELHASQERDRRRDFQGVNAWRKSGVAVNLMGTPWASLYGGSKFDSSIGVIVPSSESHLPALWAYCSSGDYRRHVKEVSPTIIVTNTALVKVPFDLEHWTKVAEEQYPNGLPESCSADPTQWLFKGNVVGSERPLHVALARLLGYRWPDQEADEFDALADEDGIVCLPAVAGERSAHERLRQLLAAAYGESSFQQTLDGLLALEGGKTLEEWLRDKAFASHAKHFHSRPFIWHIWDGRKDGFSALVNYHKLDRQTLEKLAFTHLNWWIERQSTDMASGVAGAEARLAVAQELQRKLKLILEGEVPHDIYVRWKSLAEQPLGWEPDLNDGVRLNIRPFATADVLRAKVAIHWKKDRGRNGDGSDRLNDLHFTLAEKRAAREEAARGE
jgi:hypothetical protein